MPSHRKQRRPAARPNKPLKRFDAGLISASVWRRRYRTDDGPVYLPVITLQRRYKDRAGAWQTSHYYGPEQAAAAVRCMEAALQWVMQHYRRPDHAE